MTLHTHFGTMNTSKKQQDFSFLPSSPVAVKAKQSRATIQLIRAMKQVAGKVTRPAAHNAQQKLGEVNR
jgi:hypothetical protein